jgi:hypothetical protein
MRTCPTVFYGGVIFSVFPLWYLSRLPGPGVYMLCRRAPGELREILYIGETADLACRLGPGHEQWAEAQALGMNEVLVHLLPATSAERLAVETHLRRLYRTPLNGRSPALAAG